MSQSLAVRGESDSTNIARQRSYHVFEMFRKHLVNLPASDEVSEEDRARLRKLLPTTFDLLTEEQVINKEWYQRYAYYLCDECVTDRPSRPPCMRMH